MGKVRRPCPTCGEPINRGPGAHAYCSDACRPACRAEWCDRPVRGRSSVCDVHRVQIQKMGEIRPSPWTWSTEWKCVVCGAQVEKGKGRRRHCSNACQVAGGRQRNPTATCQLCGCEFSLGRRESDNRLQRTDTKWCRTCGRESPEAIRFKRYGVTPDQYQAALTEGCAICGRTDQKLHVDHDHSCCPAGTHRTCGKCVRGLLCGSCNRALGLLGHSPDVLQRAMQYLIAFHQPMEVQKRS